ncbi:MAG: hypothetical protein U0R71_15885 [Solirubrobacterales bacterium]
MNAPARGPLRAPAGVLLTLALVPLLLSSTAGAAQAAAGARSVGAPAAARAARFWTPARMAAAEPVEVAPPARHGDRAGGRGAAPEQLRGAPVRVASRPPATRFEAVADPAAPTYRVNGVVFLEAGLFELARCSGTSVSAPNLSLVFTAGHCVNGGGRRGSWYGRNWIFVPGYRYGQRPFGVFAARWLGATPAWLAEGSENADVGVAVVGRNERGQRLAAAVGAVGFAAGLKPKQAFDIHGYPAAGRFDGETQQLCASARFRGRDPGSLFYGESGPLTVAAECNVTGGASGGGWTLAGGALNSVTDYSYPEDPRTVFGAYFGREVARLYHQAGRVR